jgi:hypothetical protein
VRLDWRPRLYDIEEARLREGDRVVPVSTEAPYPAGVEIVRIDPPYIETRADNGALVTFYAWLASNGDFYADGLCRVKAGRAA